MTWVGWIVSLTSGLLTAILMGLSKAAHNWAKGLGDRLDSQDEALKDISRRLTIIETTNSRRYR